MLETKIEQDIASIARYLQDSADTDNLFEARVGVDPRP
jgi:hypothetical protein